MGGRRKEIRILEVGIRNRVRNREGNGKAGGRIAFDLDDCNFMRYKYL
jgi:hypothetical protein